MSVRRIMGTETEYAVSAVGATNASPARLSAAVVSAAADPRTSHIRWDYGQEDPVNDARGHRLVRAQARPEMLTDEPQSQITNVIAPNAGRIYVDHAHPEYSAPETDDPFEAVLYDCAGDVLMERAAASASQASAPAIRLYRNNVDGKGASWGTHENYMMLRSVPFMQVADLLTAHFVSRQIYAGSGRVGLGEHSQSAGFQLSQRADSIHTALGLQTTFDRPIVNTRDEPHSDRRFRRVHVIVGDANRMQIPQLLKLGTTSLVLWLLESAQALGIDLSDLSAGLNLIDPVEALHTVSHDLTLGAALPLVDGASTTAWQMQVNLRGAVYAMGARVYGTDTRGEPQWPDTATKRVVTMWGQALRDVAAVRHADDDARLALREPATRIEWLLKWQLLERLRRRMTATWSDARLAAFDLRWAALDRHESIFPAFSDRVRHVHDDDAVAAACAQAPQDTRAWCRAALIARAPERVVAVSWSRVIVRDDDAPHGLRTLDMADPRGFTRAWVDGATAAQPTDRDAAAWVGDILQRR